MLAKGAHGKQKRTGSSFLMAVIWKTFPWREVIMCLHDILRHFITQINKFICVFYADKSMVYRNHFLPGVIFLYTRMRCCRYYFVLYKNTMKSVAIRRMLINFASACPRNVIFMHLVIFVWVDYFRITVLKWKCFSKYSYNVDHYIKILWNQ